MMVQHTALPKGPLGNTGPIKRESSCCELRRAHFPRRWRCSRPGKLMDTDHGASARSRPPLFAPLSPQTPHPGLPAR